MIVTSGSNDVVFKNLLQIAIYATEGNRPLALPRTIFESKDLKNVVFENIDLAGMSFCHTGLTNTVFRNCKLHGIKLEDALLKGTVFELADASALQGATIGDLKRFFSIRPGGITKPIEDPREARKWFHDRT